MLTCGTCGHTYEDITPAGRCPREADHPEPVDPPRYDRQLVPVGTEITVFDPDRRHESPIYEGDVESAFMSLEAGLYPFSVERVEGYPWGDYAYVEDDFLLIVTEDESFAVSTAVTYESVMVISTDPL